MPKPRHTDAALRVVVLRDEPAVRALAPAWSCLLQRSGCDEPMLSPTWLLNWWEVYGRTSERELRVAAWYQEGRLVGLAPLQSRLFLYRGFIPFRRLELVGADVDQGDGVASAFLNIVIEPGCEGRVVESFASALKDDYFGDWDELVLNSLDANHVNVRHLQGILQRHGLLSDLMPGLAAPYIQLPATWEAYLGQIGCKRRRLLRHTERDLDAWAQSDVRIHRADSQASLAQGLTILRELHAQRWQSVGKRGAFHSARFARFHDRVTREFLQLGALDLRWLTAAGIPVAALYNITWNGKQYAYQCGRSMALPSKLRPGIALHMAAIREAIAQGQREYDFLGGAAQYKQDLSTHARQLASLRVQRTHLRESTRLLTENAISRLRGIRRWLHSKQVRAAAQAAM